MTTIIWAEGLLIADSRITAVDGDGKYVAHSDDLLKIRNPKDLTCNGEKILAVAICGNAYASDLFEEMDGQGVDALTAEFYTGMNLADKYEASFIVITTKKCYGITRLTNGDLRWSSQKHHHSFIAGARLDVLTPMLNKTHPIAIMQKAMEVDETTGGILQAWWPGIKDNAALAFEMTEPTIVKLTIKKYNWFANQWRQLTSLMRSMRHFSRVRKALAA